MVHFLIFAHDETQVKSFYAHDQTNVNLVAKIIFLSYCFVMPKVYHNNFEL